MDASQPSVTLIICSYNHEAYITEAVKGAFEQTVPPTEIIISDDCSTDSTFEIIKEMASAYGGKSTLIINRNEKNLGIVEHVNKVFSMANGDLVVGSAGDDISLPDRIEILVRLYKEHGGKPVLFHGPVLKMGPKGEEYDKLWPKWGKDTVDIYQTALRESLYIGASSAFTRRLLNCFPPIKYKNAYEDLVWGFRAALVGGVIFLERPMVRYRIEVGVSWRLHNVRDKPLEEILRRKQQRLLMLRDVFAQRLLDIDSVADRPEYDCVREAMRKKKRKIEIYSSLLNPSSQTIKFLISNPLLFLGRCWALHKFKRRHR